jgi:hypothetical protein
MWGETHPTAPTQRMLKLHPSADQCINMPKVDTYDRNLRGRTDCELLQAYMLERYNRERSFPRMRQKAVGRSRLPGPSKFLSERRKGSSRN